MAAADGNDRCIAPRASRCRHGGLVRRFCARSPRELQELRGESPSLQAPPTPCSRKDGPSDGRAGETSYTASPLARFDRCRTDVRHPFNPRAQMLWAKCLSALAGTGASVVVNLNGLLSSAAFVPVLDDTDR